MSDNETFGKMGRSYQEKVVAAVLQDFSFAEQIGDVLKPDYFDLKYLQEITRSFYDHKTKYRTFPSMDVLEVLIGQSNSGDIALTQQVKEFLTVNASKPLNGDKGFIEESSLDFCKKQSLKDGLVKAIDMMERGNFDSIQSVIRDALGKGSTRDLGHDYAENIEARGIKSIRRPISTGWPVLDKVFNGGWEKKTLSTFIAPTGAGKSMFLVNCGAAAITQGLNVVYVTLEMADYKIGLRFDSYLTGVEINSVNEHQERVRQEISSRVTGKLQIKEWPTKTASVQTIRAYVQRLQATKGFKTDMLIVDYADLLRGSKGYGDKRFELEGIYEELRSLSQEMEMIVITADQTNRSGLEMEIVTIAQIGEAYVKATVCDVIVTISRRMEDKQLNCGRIFVAKSRLGPDGTVFPFTLNPATVKVSVLEMNQDPVAIFMEDQEQRQKLMSERFTKLTKGSKKGSDA